jgi:predicted transcriptional regulator
MKLIIKILLVFSGIMLLNQNVHGFEIGEVPPKVVLKEKLGGRLDGKPWSSEELQGKIHVMFYVDPDEKDTNNDTSEALNKENFPEDKCHFFGVINMAATWMPNFAINMFLKDKQERYPKTTYLRDNKKVLVNAWKIADDSSVILGFDKKGKLFFKKEGKLSPAETQKLIQLIRERM